MRVAEQKSSFPVTRKGSRSNACAYCTSTHEVTKSQETHFCPGNDRKRHLETLRDNSSRWGCYICTVGANRKGRSLFSCKFVTLSSRGVAPKTRGSVIACDPLAGSYIFTRVFFPGASALRASTPGLKSDDPSRASPLRDRQTVAAGEGSVDGIGARQGLSLL